MKKILIIAFFLISGALLASPVLAVGPENAVNNPHYESTPVSFDLVLPIDGVAHGMVHEWVTITPYPVNTLDKDPRVFEMKSAFVVTSPSQISQLENRWIYVSAQILQEYYLSHGVPPALIAFILAQHPEGVYMKQNHIGQ